MNRCPTCGSLYADDARFCTKDGTRLVAVPSPRGGEADARTGAFVANAGDAAAKEAAVTATAMEGQTLEGRYRIVKKLGEGGMSFVYLAEDLTGKSRCAIKVLSPALSKDQNAMARLRREADLGGRLEHPNICHIIRLGETAEQLVYIVMPYIEGEVLSDRTHRARQLPPDEVARWVTDIAAGLQRAHELQIIHRDLKPENVMIAMKNGQPERAVVMDFGLAKERRASPELAKLTATGIVLGTPEFMSPEQLRGKPLDGRTDVYSLTLMTYEMLTGKLPFQGRTQQEMMINRLRSDPTPIRAMRPDLSFSDGVEYVLNKGMARDPADRWQTAPEFATALGAAVRGESVGGGMLGRLFGR
ncbi:MAG TPA: protein kinase [Gemmatimonadaceae bacterium]|nr:protein kinase [Gemmatimonadaceae bacterium]